MRFSKRGLVEIAVICIIAVGSLVALVDGFGTGLSLEWRINIGDELIFEVYAYGVEGYWGSEQWRDEMVLDSTRIRATIESLPCIPLLFTRTSFFQSVILHTKVNCTFEDGSEIPEEYLDWITATISRCLLPVGSWETIDNLFPDYYRRPGPAESNYPYWSVDHTTTVLENTSFYIGIFKPIMYFPNSGEVSSRGWLNLTSGVPNVIWYEDWANFCTGRTFLWVRLTLQTS